MRDSRDLTDRRRIVGHRCKSVLGPRESRGPRRIGWARVIPCEAGEARSLQKNRCYAALCSALLASLVEFAYSWSTSLAKER